MKISIVGKVSVGKSSFINSLYYNLCPVEWKPIASTSLLRETFHPTKYVFGGVFNVNQKEQKITNDILRDEKLNSYELKSFNINARSGFDSIIDYPGFDDSNDSRDFFAEFEKNPGDITLFITDASRAFIDKSELEAYKRILKISEDVNKKGRYNQVLIIVNKFDWEDDEELIDLYRYVPNPKFRWCSYATYKKFENNKRYGGITASDDIDGLLKYLGNFQYLKFRDTCLINFQKSELLADRWVDSTDPRLRDAAREFCVRKEKWIPAYLFDEEWFSDVFSRLSFHQKTDCIIKMNNNLIPYIEFILDYNIRGFSQKNEQVEALKEISSWHGRKGWELLESLKGNDSIGKSPLNSLKMFGFDIRKVYETAYNLHEDTRLYDLYFVKKTKLRYTVYDESIELSGKFSFIYLYGTNPGVEHVIVRSSYPIEYVYSLPLTPICDRFVYENLPVKIYELKDESISVSSGAKLIAIYRD